VFPIAENEDVDVVVGEDVGARFGPAGGRRIQGIVATICVNWLAKRTLARRWAGVCKPSVFGVCVELTVMVEI